MNDYAKRLVEVSEVLKYLTVSDFEKIPKKVIAAIEKNKDKTYFWNYDNTKDLKDQNLCKDTIAILSYINSRYLLNGKQREIVQDIYMLNGSIEKLLSENPEDMENLNGLKDQRDSLLTSFYELYGGEYYELILVINVAENTSGWLKKTCEELSRIAQSIPFKLQEAGKEVLPIRAKIIWYGDIYLDGLDAIRETEYFWISDSMQLLEKYMQSETAISGSEKPESGIEALCLATERLAESSAKTGMIILCSEFGAYDLDILEKRGLEYTPKVRPLNMRDFEVGWNEEWSEMLGMEYSADIRQYDSHDFTAWRHCGCTLKNRSLVLYTPIQYPWDELEFDLNRCCRVNELNDAIKLIVASIDC